MVIGTREIKLTINTKRRRNRNKTTKNSLVLRTTEG